MSLAGLLGTTLVQGMVLSAAALLLLRARSGAITRVRVTTLALLLLLALPAVTTLARRVETPRLELHIDAALLDGMLTTSQTASPVMPAHAGDAPAEAPSRSPAGPLLLMWSMGVAVLLGRRALATVRARQLIARSSIASCDLRDACGLSGLEVGLRVSDRLDVPAVAGLRSPVILLPACAHSWPADHLRMVVLHELAHVRNRDLLRHVLADIACALHWIDPACWLLRLRMHRAAEERADRAVLASGADAADYARILARLARGGAHAPAPALIGRRSFLARRVDAILAGIPERDRTRPLASVLLLLVFALITAGWTLQRAIPSQIGELTVPPATLSATPERPPTPGDSLLDVVLMSWNVDERRSAATRLVAELGTGTIPRVAVLFGDTCHGGRWRAARAFRELRQPEALPLLVSTLLTDDTPAVRAMAINAIATSGLAEGIRLLRDALRDATSLQIAQVELAISTLGGTRAHAPLRALLQDVRAGRRPPAQTS